MEDQLNEALPSEAPQEQSAPVEAPAEAPAETPAEAPAESKAEGGDAGEAKEEKHPMLALLHAEAEKAGINSQQAIAIAKAICAAGAPFCEFVNSL